MGEHVKLTPGQVWEITTEHGTRHLVDLRDPDKVRRMRIPGEGRPAHSRDGQWQGHIGIVHRREMAENGDWSRGHEVVIGERCIMPGPGFGPEHVTTWVVGVRALEEDEVPPTDSVDEQTGRR